MSDDDRKEDQPSAAKLSGGAEAGVEDEQGEGMPLALGGGGYGGSGDTGGEGENRPNSPDASRH
jgi:hypothetical protein